jgi:Ca2+-binding RTX toxin-like protein
MFAGRGIRTPRVALAAGLGVLLYAAPAQAADTCNGLVPTITGTDAGEVINGTAGDDVIAGLGGNDTINGLGGNDVICGGPGADEIHGGDGTDTVSYAESSDAVFVNLPANLFVGGDAEGDSVPDFDVENIVGSVFADTLTGDDGPNAIAGLSGVDTINGNGGDDEIDAGSGDDVVFAGSGNDRVYGGDGADDLSGEAGSDDIDGGDGEDTIYGGEGGDHLKGDAGVDKIFGGGDDDLLDGGDGDDLLAGSEGTDTADYSDAAGSVSVDLGGGSASGAAGADGISGIENVIGSGFDDELVGNQGSNIVDGRGGDDTLNGADGDDTERGGMGDDTFDQGDAANGADSMSGDDGADTVDYSARTEHVTATADGAADDGEAGEGDNVMPDIEDIALRPAVRSAARTDVTAPAMLGVRTSAARISPNADGRFDTLNVSGDLSEAAQWTFEVMSGSSAFYTESGSGFAMAASWSGKNASGQDVADGTYTWRITAVDAAGNRMQPHTGTVTVDRTPATVDRLSVTRRLRVRGSRAANNRPAGWIRMRVSEAATVSGKITNHSGSRVAKFAPVQISAAGRVSLVWHGNRDSGAVVRPGTYGVVIVVRDLAGNETVKRATIRVTR